MACCVLNLGPLLLTAQLLHLQSPLGFCLPQRSFSLSMGYSTNHGDNLICLQSLKDLTSTSSFDVGFQLFFLQVLFSSTQIMEVHLSSCLSFFLFNSVIIVCIFSLFITSYLPSDICFWAAPQQWEFWPLWLWSGRKLQVECSFIKSSAITKILHLVTLCFDIISVVSVCSNWDSAL